VIGVYVNDLFIASALDNDIEVFKQEMRDRFKMSDLGLLSYYLGIEVHQDNSDITLCQSAYAQKLLEKTAWRMQPLLHSHGGTTMTDQGEH
jgi:hypothetical protein